MNSTTPCFCSLVKSCLCVTLLVTRDMWPPRFIGSAAWKRNHHYSGISQQQINTQRQLYNDKIISSLILKIKCPDAGFITSGPQTRSLVLVEKNAMDPWPPLRLGWGCLVCGKLTKSAPESSVEKTRPIFAKKKKISLHFCRARCLQGTESNWRVWIFLRVWSWLRSVSRKRNALRARHSHCHCPVSCRMSVCDQMISPDQSRIPFCLRAQVWLTDMKYLISFVTWMPFNGGLARGFARLYYDNLCNVHTPSHYLITESIYCSDCR